MAITLSNGHVIQWMTASGALGFNAEGWPHEWPFRWAGFLDPQLFTNVGKSITYDPIKGNLVWWNPRRCVRLINNGVLNKVGLTNPGWHVFHEHILPRIDFKRVNFVPSYFGDRVGLLVMVRMSNPFPIKAIELNVSCPNSAHAVSEADAIIEIVDELRRNTVHPLILKISARQDYITLAKQLLGVIQAMAINSVPWEMVNPHSVSPLAHLPGPGGGGISGMAAQGINWEVVWNLKRKVPDMPVIAPSIWNYDDIDYVLNELHADAVSFGAIHLKHFPFGAILPTHYVRRHLREQQKGRE